MITLYKLHQQSLCLCVLVHEVCHPGVFVSSWLGSLLLQVGEWIIKKLPLVKHIYSAAKQVSAAVNPANETTQSFRECVLIRHPRNGEYAFGFITGSTLLQVRLFVALLARPKLLCNITSAAAVRSDKLTAAGIYTYVPVPTACLHGLH